MGGKARATLALGLVLAGSVLFGIAAVQGAEREHPDDGGAAPTPIVQARDDCDLPCFETATTDAFHVPDAVREIQFVVFANLDDATGPARVTVLDPSGDLRYERLFTSEASPRAIQDSATWSSEPGEWRLTRSYVGTTGSLTFDAWGSALPLG